jgi:hypothetical protein
MEFPIHKVVVTGTGRTGTTFLMRVLTECGLDTGFTHRTWKRDYFRHCNAGMERNILLPNAPYIVKNPNLCETLPAILGTGRFVIDHAIVPVRDLEAATRSRICVGGENNSVPGGLLNTSDPAAQRAVLGELFHQLMFTLAAHEIPHTLLVFPRLAQDPDYTYKRLNFLLRDVPLDRFRKIFARVADPELIHNYSAPVTAPAAPMNLPPAAVYFQALRRREFRRRLRHFSVPAAITAAALMTLFEGWKLTASNWIQSAPGPGLSPYTHSMGSVAKKSHPPKIQPANSVVAQDDGGPPLNLVGF